MPSFEDHPLRHQLANELHARPFPVVAPPARAAFLALMPGPGAARDREAERAHLLALLDRHGAPHPPPGATHHTARLGRYRLKWESHTEFVTYTVFGEGPAETPFDAPEWALFPDDWLDTSPGVRVTSALVHVEVTDDDEVIDGHIGEWFVNESVAVARVLDDSAVIAGDFRIDPGGHVRFAVFARPDTGARRVGRIVQRICEIETYKTMSMLGLVAARELTPSLDEIEARLTGLTGEMRRDDADSDVTLHALIGIASELETLLARTTFRFGATGAYEALVSQRTAILREVRFGARQTFSEFLMRRYDPAMRTVKATEGRLNALAERAMRAGELLRTRVDVERSAQNQRLLESMDRRADLALRLQRTVEGLSVVAISYYAVNLATYASYPFLGPLGLSKGWTTAILTPVVVLAVWLVIRRIRASLH